MLEMKSLALHEASVIIDAVCPLVKDDPQYIDWYRQGGVTAIGPTIATIESARSTLDRLAAWRRLLSTRADLSLVRSAEDILLAKQRGTIGIFFHFQGTNPIEDNLDLVHLYKALGVGMVQLTYNVRNHVGDGCEVEIDTGLTAFGKRLVSTLNEARVIVDCSHTGPATSLAAIAQSSAPVVLSHSNVAAIHQSRRNVADDVIRGIAASGGVVGLAGFPAMVGATQRPSLEEFAAHIDAVVERVGIDHVALGLDYYVGQAGVADDASATANYRRKLADGIWGEAYPPPPHHYPQGIETPHSLHNLTAALVARGYGPSDIEKILGLNWLRVMRHVWG